jgi:two-component system NtrC family response regulator
MGNILIIEDNTELRNFFCQLTKDMGHKVTCPAIFEEGLKLLDRKDFDIVILEGAPEIESSPSWPFINSDSEKRNFSARSFIKHISHILFTRLQPTLPVIIVTRVGFSAEINFSIKKGIFDYIPIPSYIKKDGKVAWHPHKIKKRLSDRINYAFSFIKQNKELTNLLKSVNRSSIIGNSLPLQICLEQVALVAKNDQTVFIEGETGTGKELIARAIHENSQRASKEFVALNCAAITETLAESELFGIEKGSATNVPKTKKGKIEFADNGTLFLDEVGDLPLLIQAKLLRALEEHEFHMVGSTKIIKSNFRLVSATNRDIKKMVNEGKFREDLLFRLQSFAIKIPPLRERREDIDALVEYYIKLICKEHKLNKKKVSPEFIEALMAYDWPGNIRELINVLRRAITLASKDSPLHMNNLPVHIRTLYVQSEFEKSTYESMDPEGMFEVLKLISGRGLPLTQEDMLKAKTIADNSSMDNCSILKSDHHRTDLSLDYQTKEELPKWKECISNIQKNYLEKLMVTSGYNVKEASEVYGTSESHLYKILRDNEVSTKPRPSHLP